ncbi:MAG: N-acetyl-gamma-glutamyl-phosphate reductase [Gammaproteobacteria bacterium]|nr:N-acetyl-gamma-glutamyl-phosphate reductase [Gammaproteobacteria bacterium]
MPAQVFIDGQVGTTGLEIAERLGSRTDIDLLTIAEADRKDPAARACLLQNADIAILCLPDDAAHEAQELAAGQTRLLDASTAHRTASDWAYGLPELTESQPDTIRNAERVSNPGCYPQGFILTIRPLIAAGLLPADQRLSMHALCGYSGGGRSLIEKYQALTDEQREAWNVRPYALGLKHKHIPEMRHYSGTTASPLFAPHVGNFYKGMLTQVPLFLADLAPGTTLERVHAALAEAYSATRFINVLPLGVEGVLEAGYLSPTACNDTNELEIMVFGNDEQALLIARYDNLGKGASGSAVQNLNLMLGLDESTGL